MTEKGTRHETPETIMGNLVAIAEGTEWMFIAKTFAKDGFDVISEAKWYAKRGVLAGAEGYKEYKA